MAKTPWRPNAGFLKQLLTWEKEHWGDTSQLPEEFLRGKPVLSSEKGSLGVLRRGAKDRRGATTHGGPGLERLQ